MGMLGVAAQFIVMPLISSSWGLRLSDSIILIVSKFDEKKKEIKGKKRKKRGSQLFSQTLIRAAAAAVCFNLKLS